MTDNDDLFGTGDDDTSNCLQLCSIYAFDLPKKEFGFLPGAIIPIVGAAG